MNYLGHWLFSEPSKDALIGSLWPDFGKRPSPEQVSGMLLEHFDRHQWLDRFTDTSPLLEPLRRDLRPHLRKTTPVVIDVLLDHHLAKHWSRYHKESLHHFAERRYELCLPTSSPVPERLAQMLARMASDNWLLHYRTELGASRALAGIARRIRFDNPIVAETLTALTIAREREGDLHAFLFSALAEVNFPRPPLD